MSPTDELITARPDGILCDEHFRTHFNRVMAAARQSVDIATFKIEANPRGAGTPIKKLFSTFSDARARGVKIRLIVNYRPDGKGIPRSNYISAQALTAIGVDCFYITSGRCQHSKLLIADNETLILGSHNLSIRSLGSNADVSLTTSNPDAIKIVREYFEHLLKSCKPLI